MSRRSRSTSTRRGRRRAEARIWELQVVGRSKAHARQAAAAPLKLGIQPFEEFKTKLSPERASGRKKAR